MGYRAEKIEIEKKVKIVKRVLLAILIVILLGACIFSAIVPPNTWQYYVGCPDIAERQVGCLRVHFLDVGQGDCSIIELPDGRIMLIDSGNGTPENNKRILRYLNAIDVDIIDYLVVTHADSDHCGGLDSVLENKEVRWVFLPPIMAAYANEEYIAFYNELTAQKIPTHFSSREIIFNGSSSYPYTMSFLYPYSLDVTEESIRNHQSEDNNALSSILWLEYAGTSVLFTGDAPTEVENKLMLEDSLDLFANRGVDLQTTDILKVAHHGSDSSSSLDFLRYLNVKTAVISCGENNLYGHPTQTVLDNLAAVNANVYCTDEKGSVMITMFPNGSYKTEFITQD